MKKFFALLVLLLPCLVRAQTITITLADKDHRRSDSVWVSYLPGPNKNRQFKGYKLNAKQQVQIKNTIKTAGFISIDGDLIFVCPQQSISIRIITFGRFRPGSGLDIRGQNAAGVELLSEVTDINLNRKRYRRFIERRDTDAVGRIGRANLAMKQQMDEFTGLLKQKKINAGFYKLAKQEIGYTIAEKISWIIYDQYLDPDSAAVKLVGKAKYYNLLDSELNVLKKAWPPNVELTFRASRFYEYAYHCVLIKILSDTFKQTGLLANLEPPDIYNQVYNTFNENFTGKTLEYMLSEYIDGQGEDLPISDYRAGILPLYARFKKTYPNSKYIADLAPIINEIVAFEQRVAPPFKQDQKMLPRDSINTFDELLPMVNAKTVYVDIWYARGGQRQFEFDFNAGLTSYLKQNNGEIIYISMDDDDGDYNWQRTIRYYNLTGYHIRATAKLKSDLMARFGEPGNYHIIQMPHYLIVKNGKVVNDNALPPEEKEKLFEQIAQTH